MAFVETQQDARTFDLFFSVPDAYTASCVRQIESLQLKEPWSESGWRGWLEHIHQPELAEVWNKSHPMVYWSAEYGLPGLGANGGLGMLSRDHFLQAVEINQPSIFLGLAYSQRKEQRIASGMGKDGKMHYWQEDSVRQLPEPGALGMERVEGVDVLLHGAWGPARADVYKYSVGNEATQLILLKAPGEVYPAQPDSDARLWNNVVLGFGGYQVVKQMQEKGLIEEPPFYHLNESATTLGALAALDDLTQKYGNNEEGYRKALEELRDKTILTNHTLVPAAEASYSREQCNRFVFGNLRSEVVKSQLSKLIDQGGGRLKFLDLAMYLAGRYNGVSQLHAQLAADIFQKAYGDNYYGNPIEFAGVTNGVYEKGWARPMTELLQKQGVLDQYGLPAVDFEEKIEALPTAETQTVKDEAVARFRQYLLEGNRRDQFGKIVELPEDVIILGDGRRFAGYKRRWMMFSHPERLKKILENNPRAHVFYAGKAHPEDNPAKKDLQFVLEMIDSDALFRERIHYMPDWDPDSATMLGQACHGWLNNPIVGQEACGTSGEKWGLAGALLESTHDGFQAELPRDSYYSIEGATNTEEEFESYYQQMERLLSDAGNPESWLEGLRRLWKGGFLHLASGARMLANYTYLAFPKEKTVVTA